MRYRRLSWLLLAPLGAGAALLAVAGAGAQQGAAFSDPAEARRALAQARREGAEAEARAQKLEAQAAAASAAATRASAQSAALAARIQEAQASVGAAQAGVQLVEAQQQRLRARLAERQRPVLQLTAALQLLARRPLGFAIFQPGSLRDAVYLRAVLATVTPQIAARTAGLRSELDQSRALGLRARQAVGALRREQGELASRQARLAALAAAQRIAARDNAGSAGREADRALTLAEQARDLGALADDLGRAGRLRSELAALPGPVIRPAAFPQGGLPGSAGPQAAPLAEPPVMAARPPLSFILPVQGRLIAGFGAAAPGQPTSRGIVIAARPDALAVAPAPGRIVFAAPWRGFGTIVIVDHGQGWTSTITGLARLAVAVGDEVVAGTALGNAARLRPAIGLELRQGGEAVNPLDFARI